MARTPTVVSGGGILSKVVSGLLFLGVLYFVMKHPAQAADLATKLAQWGAAAVEGIAGFLNRVS